MQKPDLHGDELFTFLKENKKMLIAEKKFEMKKADAVSCHGAFVNTAGITMKGAAPIPANDGVIKNSVVINSCYWFDSHRDVHIPGIWNKTLKENKDPYLLQEHKMRFDHIISDEVKAYTRTLSWKTLGIDVEGETECLVFDNVIYFDRNEYMFGQYRKGYVKNHSVGMNYVNVQLAVNSENKDFKEEKKIWDKYYPMIANKSDVEEAGYFWAVLEAKLVEGSAVPMGSNIATPTLDTKNEPAPTTHDEPSHKLMLELKLLNLKTTK